MTDEDFKRFVEMCSRIHDIVNVCCADMYEALRSRDQDQIQQAATKLRAATIEAQLLATGINELARRQVRK